MKNRSVFMKLAGLMVFSLVLNDLGFAQSPQPEQPASVAPGITIDLSKPAPNDIELTVGQLVEFENGNRVTVSVKETDGKGDLFEDRPVNTFNQVAAYSATRSGEGEFTLTFPQRSIATATVKVVVKPKRAALSISVQTPPAAIEIDLSSKPIPDHIDLSIGQNVELTNGGRVIVLARETDGKGAFFEDRPSNTFNQVGVYRATRDGTGEIAITFLSRVPEYKTITVTVAKSVKSGVDGSVSKSPRLLGQQKSQTKQNRRALAGAVVTVTDANGAEVARTKTQRDGSFSVDLNPGIYTITSDHQLAGSHRSCSSVKVTVKSGQRENVEIRLRTGAR